MRIVAIDSRMSCVASASLVYDNHKIMSLRGPLQVDSVNKTLLKIQYIMETHDMFCEILAH